MLCSESELVLSFACLFCRITQSYYKGFIETLVLPVIAIKWNANSLSPSRVAEPLLEPLDKQAKALVCVHTVV